MPPYVVEIFKAVAVAVAGVVLSILAEPKRKKPPRV